jgi:hypothetical protein
MCEPEDEKNLVQYTMYMNEHSGYLDLDKSPVNESMPPWENSDLEFLINNLKMNESKNHLWKYNEDKILKDIEDYVTSTYHGHYCGDSDGYADIQTIDLMAAKKLAAGFCQANILKYGSRYGDKDGRNKRDLMKVIHYAMLLLHFDGHYTRQDNGLTEFSR